MADLGARAVNEPALRSIVEGPGDWRPEKAQRARCRQSVISSDCATANLAKAGYRNAAR